MYNTKHGRELLRQKHVLPNLAERKWPGILYISHKFQ
jgi:hypothetical protein